MMLLLVPALTPSAAAAAASQTSVEIQSIALLALSGADVNVALKVQCTGTGVLTVNVTQPSPPATDPLGATGMGVTDVVCDGQQRLVAVSVGGTGFNLGAAAATAELVVGSTDVDDARSIKIVRR